MSFHVNSATANRAQYPSKPQGPDVFASVRANYADYSPKSLGEILADKDSLSQKLRSAFDTLDRQSLSIFEQLKTANAPSVQASKVLSELQAPKVQLFESVLLQQREKKFLTAEVQKEAQIAAFLKNSPQHLNTLGTLADQRMDSVRKLLAIQEASGTLTTLSAGIDKESSQWTSVQDQQNQLNAAYNKLDQTRYETERELFSKMRNAGYSGTAKPTGPIQDALIVQHVQLSHGARLLDLDSQSKMIDLTRGELDSSKEAGSSRQILSQALGVQQQALSHRQQMTLREMQTQNKLDQFFQRNATDSRIAPLVQANVERIKLNKQIAGIETQVAMLSEIRANLDPASNDFKRTDDSITKLTMQQDPLIQKSITHLSVLNQFAKEIEPGIADFGNPKRQEINNAIVALYTILSPLVTTEPAAIAIRQRIEILQAAADDLPS